MRRTILCLANSYKHGGRCVAGVCIDDGTWIRLRGKAEDGALNAEEYALNDGSEVRLLDLIEVDLHFALPSDSHPEDWQISPMRWRLVERPASTKCFATIAASADKATTILRGYRDRMTVQELQAKPLQSSLVLVCPSDLWWWVREERSSRKYRAVFHRHHVAYDLAVTDPRWLDRLNLMPAGIYPHSTFAPDDAVTWLTISLSEAFHGWHYKLVAAVILSPK